ncbi:MAG: DUF4383 domain-containing protein [Nitriliruptorales bacterium]
MNLSATRFGNVFGAAYLAIGLIGFVLTGFDGVAGTHGETLIVFEINPLHNVVHALVGLALLTSATAGEWVARQAALVVGGGYALVGVLGFFAIGTDANILALTRPTTCCTS